MAPEHVAALRALPAVGTLLVAPEIRGLVAGLSPAHVVRVIQLEVELARQRIVAGGSGAEAATVVDRVVARLRLLREPKLRPVINATGVVLHTNLGRAPISQETAEAMRDAALGYTPLELDLETGGRGGRMDELAALLAALTGCEAALVVNNNAAATALVLAALAAGREVLLARGEAVEIGGGFRIPAVMAESGAELVAVGTTNRTYIRDFEAGCSPHTGALLKVHASNFRVVGFTHETPLAELAALARRIDVPLIHDLGSGALLDTAEFGLGHEPTVQESVTGGASVTLFSGDKLLGGPQAGIIIGERRYLDRIARHPLARAMRADKTCLAGLAATLRHYLRGEEVRAVPVWRMIAATADGLHERAAKLRAALAGRGLTAGLATGRSTVGGGSLPGETLPTTLVTLDAASLAPGGFTLDRFAAALRAGDPPIIGVIGADRFALDLRTVFPEEEEPLRDRLLALLGTP